MGRIHLSSSREANAIVDDSDYSWLRYFKWYLDSRGYAVFWKKLAGRKYAVSMHGLILKPDRGMVTDHINGNRLDNRKINLRQVTHQQNTWNSKIKRSDTKSPRKGVVYSKQRACWSVTLKAGNKRHFIGNFSNLKEAVYARLQAEKEFYKEFAPNANTTTQKSS